MVGLAGVEPTYGGYEPPVLPLDDSPIRQQKSYAGRELPLHNRQTPFGWSA